MYSSSTSPSENNESEKLEKLRIPDINSMSEVSFSTSTSTDEKDDSNSVSTTSKETDAPKIDHADDKDSSCSLTEVSSESSYSQNTLDQSESVTTIDLEEEKVIFIRFYPAELDDDEVPIIMSQFGIVKSIREQNIPGHPTVGTGTFIISMIVKKHIPDIILYGGFPLEIWYKGVQRSCRKCLEIGHEEKDCRRLCKICKYLGTFCPYCSSVRDIVYEYFAGPPACFIRRS